MRDYSKQSQIQATERDVEITGLETCVIEGNFDWNIVEIHTDVCTDSLTTAAWASATNWNLCLSSRQIR